MKNHALRSAAVSLSLICLTSTASAAVTALPSHRNIDIKVSNDNGAIYGAGADDTYYINAPGGG